MAKLSVIIPSRNERFLIPTIEDVFRNARGEVEVVAVLQEKWPDDWKDVVAKYPNLHTIYYAEGVGMRPAINAGAASAISRGAKYLMKLDAHCIVGKGFDEILKADCDSNWVVIPRRLRLDAENWKVYEDGRPPIDYHYLSFPDNVKDFGGPGLNGKVWDERARERFGKPEYDIDDELSSQGSCWFMHSAYFTELELMDTDSYGPFWNEAQEILMKCWLSGGRGVVNKKTTYAHLHKGSKYGRGYHLPKEWLNQGATFTKKWLFNEAWPKQTLPFKTLIERFWPVPTWPENWEELVYGSRGAARSKVSLWGFAENSDEIVKFPRKPDLPGLEIHVAKYGVLFLGDNDCVDVTDRLQSLVQNNSLDVVVTNDSLKVGNPFRGQKKKLRVTYSYDGGEEVTVEREERDWLIIGQSARYVKQPDVERLRAKGIPIFDGDHLPLEPPVELILNRGDLRPDNHAVVKTQPLSTAAALTDLLIRRFNIPSHRLRGPMPIEIPTFHRNDLAKLFAELGFNKGAEIGVAEGNYSEVLVKANPQLELLCVDPWHAYSGNPQNKSKEKNEYAYREAERKLKDYNVKLDMRLSMDAVRDVADGSLDFCYIDAHHSYPFVMSDLIFWSQKVRSGGIVSGDDIYQLNEKWGSGPMEAIYHYTEAMKINPWFLISAHKSVDFFFVKQ